MLIMDSNIVLSRYCTNNIERLPITATEAEVKQWNSLMLIDAICGQAGYNSEDEGEARTSKGQDIVFLD
jgi:hypothetical protein